MKLTSVSFTTAIAAIPIALAACSSLSAAGSGSPSKAATPASARSAVVYSRCMRSHGVPSFPDPSASGLVPKADPQALGVSSTALQSAQRTCARFYPSRGSGVLTKDSIGQCEETGDCPPALVQAAMNALRAFARCMRSHGLPGWPDPTIDSEGRPEVNLLHVQGFDPNSAQTSNIMPKCYHVMPGGAPVPVIAPGRPG